MRRPSVVCVVSTESTRLQQTVYGALGHSYRDRYCRRHRDRHRGQRLDRSPEQRRGVPMATCTAPPPHSPSPSPASSLGRRSSLARLLAPRGRHRAAEPPVARWTFGLPLSPPPPASSGTLGFPPCSRLAPPQPLSARVSAEPRAQLRARGDRPNAVREGVGWGGRGCGAVGGTERGSAGRAAPQPTPIRRGRSEADMSLSDREPSRGFRGPHHDSSCPK